jgi:hypothetical protein
VLAAGTGAKLVVVPFEGLVVVPAKELLAPPPQAVSSDTAASPAAADSTAA